MCILWLQALQLVFHVCRWRLVCSADREGYLRQLARDNCQLLFNQLYQLPTQTRDDVTTVTLPAIQLRCAEG